ncbi:MAG: VWA domain-containing protein [Planctomycetota bacterium]
MIRLLHPEALWLLTLLPLVAMFLGRRGPVASLRFPSLAVAGALGRARRSRAGLLRAAARLLVLACVVVALARPQLGRGTTEVEASGIDIMLAVDVSTSMEALDFEKDGERVNRVEAVKAVVAKFIDGRPNDRIGLVAFAGRPYLVSPLTLDHDWLLRRLDTLKTGMMEDGTAIGSAIASSTNRLRDEASKSRVAILLTDGMNNAGEVAPVTAAEAAQALGTKVYTIGAGTRGEAPVPVRDAFGREAIALAKVDVDEETLTKVAEMTGARYYRATDSDSLGRIYDEIDRLETSPRTIKRFERHEELFAWALLPGLALLALELALAHTRFRRIP